MYKYIDALPAEGLAKLPHWALDELSAAALHLPLACAQASQGFACR